MLHNEALNNIHLIINQKYDNITQNIKIFENNILNSFFKALNSDIKNNQPIFIYKLNLSNLYYPKLEDLIDKISYILYNKGYYHTKAYEDIFEYDNFDMTITIQTFCTFEVILWDSKL
jgi:hypothetical protein